MENNQQDNQKDNNKKQGNPIQDFAKQKAQQKVKQQISKAGQKAGKKMASQLAKQASKQVVMTGARLLVSTPVGWIIIGVFLLLLLAVGIIAFIAGSGSSYPTCDGLSAENNRVAASNPVLLTLDNCTSNITITWVTPAIGGSFNPSGPTNNPTTSYTPPQVTTPTAIDIQVNVCNSNNASMCNSYSTSITIIPNDCSSQGGVCQSSCSSGSTQVPANCASGICCRGGSTPDAGFAKFFCQYDQDYNLSTCDIWKYGCGPTTAAMILKSYGVNGWTPVSVARATGVCNEGTNFNDDFRSFFINHGFRVGNRLASNGYLDTSEVRRYLNNGWLIFTMANIRYSSRSCQSSNMTNTPCGGHNSGHSLLITGIDNENNLTIFDPTYCLSDTKYVPRITNARAFQKYGVPGTYAKPVSWTSYVINGRTYTAKYWMAAYPVKK